MKVYVVVMLRYGNHEAHSYVLGVWSLKEHAIQAGEVERAYRCGKYEPEISEWEVDGNEYDAI